MPAADVAARRILETVVLSKTHPPPVRLASPVAGASPAAYCQR
jgi:hypothetical protein